MLDNNTEFIAFFDILGYNNLLAANEISTCVTFVKDLLNSLSKELKEGLSEHYNNDNEKRDQDIDEVIKCFRRVILSDTIIFYPARKPDNIKDTIFYYTFFFLLKIIQQKSFDEGFPLRGCVDYGEFYCGNEPDLFLAGRSIIDCHTESNQLEFSGVVLTNNVINKLEEIFVDPNDGSKRDPGWPDYRIRSLICRDVIVSLKKGESKKHLLKWFDEQTTGNRDLRQYIVDAFYGKGKSVDEKTRQKIDNTENILRYFIFAGKTS